MQVLYKYYTTNYFYIYGFKTPTKKDKIFDIIQTKENIESYKGKIQNTKEVGNNMFTHSNKNIQMLTKKIKGEEMEGKVEIKTTDACFACDACTQTVQRKRQFVSSFEKCSQTV